MSYLTTMNQSKLVGMPELTRRGFVRAGLAAGASLALGGWRFTSNAGPLRAGPSVRLLSLTGTGDAALHTAAGVRFGVEEAQHAAQLFGGSVEAVPVPFSASDTEALARELASAEGVTAVIGGADACATAAKLATGAQVLYVNTGCPDDALRSSCSALVFHVAPSTAMQHDAMTQWLDSESSAGGGGATDTQRATVVAWAPTLERFGASQLNDRYVRANGGAPMTSDAWLGWMAVKVVWESALRAKSGNAADVAAYLARKSTEFDGHKGRPLSFRAWNHQLRQPLYVVARNDAGESRVAAELPIVPRGTDESSQDVLDMLGGAGRESGECR